MATTVFNILRQQILMTLDNVSMMVEGGCREEVASSCGLTDASSQGRPRSCAQFSVERTL
jgi:hypothetical protein